MTTGPDSGDQFIPILVGVNAAKQLGINQMLGGFIGSILMVPDFAAPASSGKPFTVYGIPCTVASYVQTVLPIMLSVYFFSLVLKLIKKFMPDALATVLTPFLSLLVSLREVLTKDHRSAVPDKKKRFSQYPLTKVRKRTIISRYDFGL